VDRHQLVGPERGAEETLGQGVSLSLCFLDLGGHRSS
jgi:hypothetical protein